MPDTPGNDTPNTPGVSEGRSLVTTSHDVITQWAKARNATVTPPVRWPPPASTSAPARSELNRPGMSGGPVCWLSRSA